VRARSQEWRAADRQAHACEQRVVRAAMLAQDGKATAPTPEDRDEALKPREIANRLFNLAMEEMKQRAEVNNWR
jgi:hypothetical protein